MYTELYWIEGPWPGRLAISARPRGGDWLEDEVKRWRRAGLDIIVSLLTPDEEEALDLQHEKQCCRDSGLDFRSFPIVDRSVPASEVKAMRLIEQLGADLIQGRNIAVHCRQGIGRSGLIAASLLVARGIGSEDAMKRVSDARGVEVPETPRQRDWITSSLIPG
jgi:protein-tyrosine phosphatase